MGEVRLGGFVSFAAVVTLASSGLIHLASALAEFWFVRDLRILGQQALDEEQPSAGFMAQGCAGLLVLAITILTAVAFLIWFRRAYQNILSLRPGGLEYSPGWAVGGFFVPVLNLIRPYDVACEIWTHSDPESVSREADSDFSWVVPRSRLVTSWWAMFILAAALGTTGGRLAWNATTAKDWLTASYYLIPSDLLNVAGAALAVALVLAIERRQGERLKLVRRTEPEEEGRQLPAPALGPRPRWAASLSESRSPSKEASGTVRRPRREYRIWLAGGLAGGSVGAIAWVVLTFKSGYEIPFLVFAIGILAGLGVRAAARGARGAGPAAVALLAGLLSMGAAKVGHLVASFPRDAEANALVTLCGVVLREHERAGQPVDTTSFGWETAYPPEIRAEAEKRWNALSPEEQEWYLSTPWHPALLNREGVISGLATKVAGEWADEGRALEWPPNANRRSPEGRDDFPPDVWQEAVARWQAFTPQERRNYEKTAVIAFLMSLILSHIGSVLSLWDLPRLAFAAGVAFLVGFGLPSPATRGASFGCSVLLLALLSFATWMFVEQGALDRQRQLGMNEPVVAVSGHASHGCVTRLLSFSCPAEWTVLTRAESADRAEIVLARGDRATIELRVDSGAQDLATRMSVLGGRFDAALEACETDWVFGGWGEFHGSGKALRCSRDGEPVQLKVFVAQIGPGQYLEVRELYEPDSEAATLEAEYQIQGTLEVGPS